MALVERALEHQRLALRQRRHRADGLQRRIDVGPHLDPPRPRVGELHLRLQDVEPRHGPGLVACPRQCQLRLGQADLLVGDADALLAQQRVVEHLDDAILQVLPRPIEFEARLVEPGLADRLGAAQPSTGVDRLGDVEAHDVLALEVRLERGFLGPNRPAGMRMMGKRWAGV